jgi:peptide subunit release factor 1 (eRF1)
MAELEFYGTYGSNLRFKRIISARIVDFLLNSLEHCSKAILETRQETKVDDVECAPDASVTVGFH